MSEDHIDGWVAVFRSGTDYEAEMVRDRLVDSGLSAVVLTHRDHAFNLTVGDMSTVRVLVPPGQKDEALAILHSRPISGEELDDAAMRADPAVGSGDDEEPE